ncbi:MAG: SPFH domain-containing protein [Candidatus Magasanikbacteria bacterium]|jgi:membrane protease subunit (stomatin/prohibitin family)|nr:SPFH domain-containing protein [Candidatus Magasanikbacteria bacterium]
MPKLMGILEFLDPTGQIMVKRVPDSGDYEIKWGAQLTVRESQTAIFFRDGKALDIFGPGRHVLQTQNIPIITKLVTRLGYGTNSPFRAEVYFINMKLFPNLRWGTSEPILFRDTELQMIRLRSFGIFSIQISDPSLFLNKVVGTQGIYVDTEIENYLKNIILTRLTDVFGEHLKSVFDLPKDFNELSIIVRTNIQNDFDALGLKIHNFLINSISVPPEVQEMIDSRSGMAAIGDMDQFLKFKAALAMESAAENPNGVASAGVGMGAGMGMGFMLPQMLSASMQSGQAQREQSESPMDKLKKLKELFDMGVVSQEEYDKKKEKLLGEI